MQAPISFTTIRRRQIAARRIPLYVLLFPVLGAFVFGLLAYQAPVRTAVAIGSLGDRVFLQSSEALDASAEAAGTWYADELGDGGRSRWTRSQARLLFAGIGGGDADVMLRVQGWPEDVLRAAPRQPTVRVSLSGATPEERVELGQFTPTSGWQEQGFAIPAALRSGSDLVIELQVSDTFTGTEQFPGDVRPKGVRVERAAIDVRDAPGLAADWMTLLQLAGTVLLLTLALHMSGRRDGTTIGAGFAVGAGVAAGLALWRPWTAALIPLLLLIAAMGLILAGWPTLRRLRDAARARVAASSALETGLVVAIVVSALAIVVAILRRPADVEAFVRAGRWDRSLPLMAGGLMLLAGGATILPDILVWLRRRLVTGYLTPVLFALTAGVILGWELQLLRDLPFVGHADYADNAVVARSLLRGEAWRVPYVTQFYELVQDGSVYRPQETWPLLQPVWMAPWMALFGTTAFAARVSNLVFNLLLLLLVYDIGARLWDRRVGALAAVVTLLNQFFFLMTIFSTTDLGFTVLSMAAIWLFFRATYRESDESPPMALWIIAGVLTGLMMLQKPSGAIFAAGMLAWMLVRWWRGATLPMRGLALWMVVAGLVLSPYLIRNLILFGRPVYSTESYDAWILTYTGSSRESWEDIYRVYLGDTPDRSWILRWGWDRTINKVLTQLDAAWSYVAPPAAKLVGLPFTWLAVVGLLLTRGRQRSLFALVGMIGVVYTLFLATYWHANEERYFVPFVPWFALLAMGALCTLFDRVIQRYPLWSGLAGGLAVLLLWAGLQPHVQAMRARLDPQSPIYWGREWLPDLAAYRWLEENTQPDDVIMTRVPWQLSLEADRPSLMIPNAPLTSDDPATPSIMQIARFYGADYLVLNAITNPRGDAARTLRPMMQGEALPGFELVYSGTDDFGRRPIYIYRFPADYAGAPLLQSP